MNTVKLQSIITCPNCGHRKEETMPTDSCQYFYECEKMQDRFKTKTGRLLCVLQLRNSALSPSSAGQEMLLKVLTFN